MPGEPIVLWGISISPNQLIVLIAFICLAAGYFLSVFVNRGRKGEGESDQAVEKERAAGNVSFMKGINYILSDKPDQAIEELVRAASVDTATVETYVALGNLFRSKGEIDRAVRIRQSIIIRPNLEPRLKLQATFDLGEDYRCGGFYDRAIKTFKEVIELDPKMVEAHLRLVQMYEETRDWPNAAAALEKAAKLTGEKPTNVLAHYQVEMGKDLAEKGMNSQARAAFKKAQALDDACVDAHLHQGDLWVREGKPKKALAAWSRLMDVAPEMTFLTFGRLARISADLKDLKPLETFFTECTRKHPTPLAHLTLGRLLARKGEVERSTAELRKALEIDPGLLEARRELGRLLLAEGRVDEALEAYRDLLGNLADPQATFQCGRCGLETTELMWRCPQCFAWDTMTLHRHQPVVVEPLDFPEPPLIERAEIEPRGQLEPPAEEEKVEDSPEAEAAEGEEKSEEKEEVSTAGEAS